MSQDPEKLPVLKFVKLLDEKGIPTKHLLPVQGSVDFNVRDCTAHAWAADGTTLLGEMVKARVSWIGAAGVRLEGMEPFEGPHGTQYRAMEWQLIFPQAWR